MYTEYEYYGRHYYNWYKQITIPHNIHVQATDLRCITQTQLDCKTLLCHQRIWCDPPHSLQYTPVIVCMLTTHKTVQSDMV